MTLIVLNLYGAIAVFGGALLAHLVRFIAGAATDSPVFFITFGLIALAFDLAIRTATPERRFFSPKFGGHIFYVPAWIIGAVALCGGIQKCF